MTITRLPHTPIIGEFRLDDGLILKQAPNGGWVVLTAVRHRGEMETIIAAFSNADEMLATLCIVLQPSWGVKP